MSNQARLLLLSGTGGSGTTSAVAATVEALEAEGLHGLALDPFAGSSDDPDHADAQAPAALIGLRTQPPMPWWGSVPVLGHLVAWQRIRRAVATDGVDAVVVDLGELHQAMAMVDFPSSARRVLSAVLSPDLASRSDEKVAGSAFSMLSETIDDVSASADLIASDATVVRLVAEARGHSLDHALRAAATLAMLGADVDGIIVNRCARKSDNVPGSVLREQRELLAAAQHLADGPLVWKATDRVRAVPKGRSAMGPLGRSRVLRADSMTVEQAEDGFVLHVPLAELAVSGAEIGRYEDALVVAFDGATRWLDLPSVLRRCRAVDAQRTSGGLRVEFVPDPSQWREDARFEGAA